MGGGIFYNGLDALLMGHYVYILYVVVVIVVVFVVHVVFIADYPIQRVGKLITTFVGRFCDALP